MRSVNRWRRYSSQSARCCFDRAVISARQQSIRSVRYFYWRNLIDAYLRYGGVFLVLLYPRSKEIVGRDIFVGRQGIKI